MHALTMKLRWPAKPMHILLFFVLFLSFSANASAQGFTGSIKAYANKISSSIVNSWENVADSGKLLKGEAAYKKHDYATALKYWRPLAQHGNAQAQFNLGLMYQTGQGVGKDLKQSVSWYRKSAMQGYVSAQYNLGYIYDSGSGVSKDEKQAYVWYRKAALQGDAMAENNLGFLYEYGLGIAQDYKQCLKWYQKAADQGLAKAQYNLGMMYGVGRGVAKNQKLELSWYRKAADKGFAMAQYNLGVMYDRGNGVAQDLKQAAKLYQLAAAQGFPDAQYNLGVAYTNGRGVKKDLKRAAVLFRQAAKQGMPEAQFNLGVMYAQGRGVAHNDTKAVVWIRKAAMQGDVAAEADMGYLYEHGIGLKQDLGLAKTWYQKAAAQGSKTARQQLAQLGRRHSAASRKLPSHRVEVALVNETMRKFAEAVNAKSFAKFHAYVSHLWQRQYSVKKFNKIFRSFTVANINMLPALRSHSPRFDAKPTIDQNGVLELAGHYATKPSRILYKLDYIREGSDWKLIGINVQLKQLAQLGSRHSAASRKLPSQKVQVALVNETMRRFAEAVNARSFRHFHAYVSQPMQQQISAAKLEQVFKSFIDAKINLLPVLRSQSPRFDAKPTIDQNGELELAGHYATKPSRILYKLDYIHEGSAWKLIGINVQLK